MSLLCYFLFAIAVLLARCDAALATTNSDQTKLTIESVDAPLSARYLRSKDKTGEGVDSVTSWDGDDDESDSVDSASSWKDDEDRGLIPSSVRAAVKDLKTKDDIIYTSGIGKGLEQGLWGKVVKWFRKTKTKVDYIFRTASWKFRFTVWLMNKRTPAQMYDRLKVRETTGMGDKNYRTYVYYVRFYEHFRGPVTDNPLFKYGPFVKTT